MILLGFIFHSHEGWQSKISILVHPWDGKGRNNEVAEPHCVVFNGAIGQVWMH